MAEVTGDNVFKVLSGNQFGAEVFLSDGTYSFGSGAEADIQLDDVALQPIHGYVRLRDGKVEVRAAQGDLVTASGLSVTRGDETWREIAQMDAISAGLSKFVIAGPNANWATFGPAAPAPAPRKAGAASVASLVAGMPRRAVYAAGSVLAIVAVAGLLGSFGSDAAQRSAADVDARALATLRESVAAMPFAREVTVVERADGTIAIEGYVEEQVERRAIQNSLDESGLPATLRIYVRENLRADVQGTIDSLGVPASFTLDAGGNLTLTGTILDPEAAARLVQSIETGVFGLASVKTEIRTADAILADLREIADDAGLADLVIFRLDNLVVEATGIVPRDKMDNWVGLIGVYSRRFANEIPLRSFVTLDQPAAVDTAPVIIGSGPVADAEPGRIVAPETLAEPNEVDAQSLFAGQPAPAEAPTTPVEPGRAEALSAAIDRLRDLRPDLFDRLVAEARAGQVPQTILLTEALQAIGGTLQPADGGGTDVVVEGLGSIGTIDALPQELLALLAPQEAAADQPVATPQALPVTPESRLDATIPTNIRVGELPAAPAGIPDAARLAELGAILNRLREISPPLAARLDAALAGPATPDPALLREMVQTLGGSVGDNDQDAQVVLPGLGDVGPLLALGAQLQAAASSVPSAGIGDVTGMEEPAVLREVALATALAQLAATRPDLMERLRTWASADAAPDPDLLGEVAQALGGTVSDASAGASVTLPLIGAIGRMTEFGASVEAALQWTMPATETEPGAVPRPLSIALVPALTRLEEMDEGLAERLRAAASESRAVDTELAGEVVVALGGEVGSAESGSLVTLPMIGPAGQLESVAAALVEAATIEADGLSEAPDAVGWLQDAGVLPAAVPVSVETALARLREVRPDLHDRLVGDLAAGQQPDAADAREVVLALGGTFSAEGQMIEVPGLGSLGVLEAMPARMAAALPVETALARLREVRPDLHDRLVGDLAAGQQPDAADAREVVLALGGAVSADGQTSEVPGLGSLGALEAMPARMAEVLAQPGARVAAALARLREVRPDLHDRLVAGLAVGQQPSREIIVEVVEALGGTVPADGRVVELAGLGSLGPVDALPTLFAGAAAPFVTQAVQSSAPVAIEGRRGGVLTALERLQEVRPDLYTRLVQDIEAGRPTNPAMVREALQALGGTTEAPDGSGLGGQQIVLADFGLTGALDELTAEIRSLLLQGRVAGAAPVVLGVSDLDPGTAPPSPQAEGGLSLPAASAGEAAMTLPLFALPQGELISVQPMIEAANEVIQREGGTEEGGTSAISPNLLALVAMQNEQLQFGKTLMRLPQPLSALPYSMEQPVACWDGSSLTPGMVPTALLLLDALSVSNESDLTGLTPDVREVVMETALSPERVKACLRQTGTAFGEMVGGSSAFLSETARNPDFVEFLFRNVPKSTLTLAGANLVADRYVELADGRKLGEGAAPDITSRITSIGDLGILVRTAEGTQVQLYGDGLGWRVAESCDAKSCGMN